MSRTVKWIIGILIGLLVLAALAAGGFWVFNHWNGANWMMSGRAFRGFYDDRDLPLRGMHPGMMPFGGMRGWWFGGFSPFGMLFGGLLQLGILALVIYGVVALIRGLTRPQGAAVTPMAAGVKPAAEVMPAAAMHACANCGYAVQEGWKHCPNCGQAQTS